MAENETKPTCFMAMPITTHEGEADTYGDANHWRHVMEHLFIPAIEAIGYKPIIPAAKGSAMIHAGIVSHLSTADLVLVDLSSHNPNVTFELGVRTAVNLPVSIVHDGLRDLPFDLTGINVPKYDHSISPWNLTNGVNQLSDHLKESVASCNGKNPLWEQYGLTIKATAPQSNETPLEAKLDLLTRQINELRHPPSNPISAWDVKSDRASNLFETLRDAPTAYGEVISAVSEGKDGRIAVRLSKLRAQLSDSDVDFLNDIRRAAKNQSQPLRVNDREGSRINELSWVPTTTDPISRNAIN